MTDSQKGEYLYLSGQTINTIEVKGERKYTLD